MRIFCTNDDGIESLGLVALATRLDSVAEVVVGAPERQMSGTGTSVLIPGAPLDGIKVRPHRWKDSPLVDVQAVDVTPAMTVLLAHRGAFGGSDFDIVVSGPNLGANVGPELLHSGTVGAAMTAASYGTHGVALSLGVGFGRTFVPADTPDANWETAAEIGRAVVLAIGEADLPEAVLLNINVPDAPLDMLRGVRTVRTSTGSAMRINNFEEVADPSGNGETTRVIKATVTGNLDAHDDDTDIAAVRDGYVALSWMSLPGAAPPATDAIHVALDAARSALA